MQDWLIPFQYEYLLNAMLTCTLIGGVCGLLSGFITLKGWSLMGDALSHAVVPGVALAYLAGVPFALGAFTSGLLAAGAMAFVKTKTPVREDAVIGIVFTSFFALGLLLISLYPSRVNLKSIIFGNILGISHADTWQVVIVAGVCLLVLAFKWRDLLLFCFDANQARALGLNVGFLHVLLLLLLSATAVAALQAVGAILVIAVLVIPGATAYLLTDRFGVLLIIGAIFGAVTSFAGVYVSYFINGETGGCIVTLQASLFVVALIFAPKHGVLAGRRTRRRAIKEVVQS